MTHNDIKDRYEVGRTKSDFVAEQRLSLLKVILLEENFYTHAQRASTMVGVSDFFGDLYGKQIWEYGFGLGENIMLFAKTIEWSDTQVIRMSAALLNLM